MGRFCFRSDANHAYGLGHLKRCLSLATVLRDDFKQECFFLTKDEDGKNSALIETAGFSSHVLNTAVSLNDELAVLDKLSDVSGIVFDLGHKDHLHNSEGLVTFMKRLKSRHQGKLISIDDYRRFLFPFDLQIIPYLNAETMDYQPLSPSSELLLGLSFFVFGSEYRKYLNQKRSINQDASKILVSLGGSDPSGSSSKITKVLSSMGIKDIEVVVGPHVSTEVAGELDSLESQGICCILKNANMAEALLRADLAIVSGGLVKYEAAFLGTPALIWTHFDEEMHRVSEYVKTKAAWHLGDSRNSDEVAIKTRVSEAIHDYKGRIQMSQTGQGLLDGQGAFRIAERILNTCNLK